MFLATRTLVYREIIRFLRQKHRIAGALGTPVVFWILLGLGLMDSFESDLNYLQYFFPGTVVLILLFTAIFSTISIIEDRREGFLQGVLVSPISRWSLVLGKLLGGTLLALCQGLIFLTLSPFLGAHLSPTGILFVVVIMILMSFGLTGLGFVIAWRLDSTQGFHAIMNLFLMPLWLLSGSLFPLDGVSKWIKWIVVSNPLTYSVSALHQGLYQSFGSSVSIVSNPFVCLFVTLGFAIIMFALALASVHKKTIH